MEAHTIICPGQISEGARVSTMDAPRWGGAQRTGRAGLGRAYVQGDLRGGLIDLTHLEVQRGRIGQQAGQDGGGRCRDESDLLLSAMVSLGQHR